MPGLGTSDHVSIDITLNIGIQGPDDPVHKPTRLWKYAPWDHIQGDVKRALAGWDPRSFGDVDSAEKA